MTNGHHLVIEAKNQVDLSRHEIYKSEAEQLGHDSTWFNDEYPGETHTPVLIHPSLTLAYDAYLASGSKVIQKNHLERIVENTRRFVVDLASKAFGPMAGLGSGISVADTQTTAERND